MSESSRYDLSARTFRNPFRLTLSPPTIRDPYGADHRTYLPLSGSTLPSSLTRKFHLKDTALYSLAVPYPDIEDVFDEVWKTWYPRRNLQRDVRGLNAEAVFCRAMKPVCEVGVGMGGVQRVVGFHEHLVKVVDADQGNWEGGRMLEESFRRVFIVLDRVDWRGDGVLVVCREEFVEEHGLGEYHVVGMAQTDEVIEGEKGRVIDGGWVVYRRVLAGAVKSVIYDPERRKAAAPVDERYREKKFQL